MAELRNVQEVIENSGKLYYTSINQSITHTNGVRAVVNTETTADVDYENKKARVVTVTSQLDNRIGVACYYKDMELVAKAIDLSSGVEDADGVSQTLTNEEWQRLFAKNGSLRPVVFDYLRQNLNDSILPNTLAFTVDFPINPINQENSRTSSNVVVNILSENTLVINHLYSCVNSETNDLSVGDTKITVYLVESV